MKRILIIGAGFAGMWSALSAARLLDQHPLEAVEIVLVAPQPELHMRPRLYETNAAGMRAPLLPLFDAVGVRYVQGSVETIDTERHRVGVRNAENTLEEWAYDKLILASGSRLQRPAVVGLSAHAFSVDQLAEAAALEAHIAGLAQRPNSVARNTVVVAGGGFTGIETAAEMPHRLRAVLGEHLPVRVIVVDPHSEIGAELGAGPRPVIDEALRALGVTYRLGTAVVAVEANGVALANGEFLEASTVIWTAGVRADALTGQIPAKRDSLGRLLVDSNLKVQGHDDVYATGDVAKAATDDEGNYAMMSCQHAMNLGRSCGHNVMADLLGLPTIAYRQPKYVTCLDLGPWGAVYTEGWGREVKLSGAEAKALKTSINTQWIYPPRPDRAEAFEAADPRRIVVA